MDLLLDTHAFLWWDADAAKLGEAARAAISNPENAVYVSAASVWEIAIKAAKGKLSFSGSPMAAITANGFHPLSITVEHTERAGALPWEHQDPFDRMLVAQAQAESLVLVHADSVISGYRSVPHIWARD
jgi:PIN domain nuclease of toxin-antitoxin system